jgi:hypothetical protein
MDIGAIGSCVLGMYILLVIYDLETMFTYMYSMKMRFFSGVFAFLLFFLLSFPVLAETVTLTLDDAVVRALDQNLDLKKGAIDLAQAEYSAARLWSEIFPVPKVSASIYTDTGSATPMA